ncbi:MAG: OmpW family protein [Pseudomonadota bacterium]
MMRKTTLAGLAICAAMQPTTVAAEAGDWLIRARAIMIAPNEDAGPVSPTFPGGSVSVDNAVMPEIDFTYFITNHIGAELILATTNHDISGEGDLVGLGEIADTWVLPPTLTLQYHFLPENNIRPYVGAGINWTIFYGEDSKDSLNDAIGQTSVDLDNSFGWALQAGVDIDVTDTFFFNADIKYIDIDTTATLNTGGAINTVDVDLDPFVFGIGFGVRF